MSERVKTILLIIFIVGVIGAFNAIISLSQNTGTNPWQTVAQVLGLVKKPAPVTGRKLDFVPGELSKNQPATINNTAPQPAGSSPTPKPTASPTPVNQAIQTTPELPPLPPVGGNVKGAKTSAVTTKLPLPTLPTSKTLGVSAQNKKPVIPPLPPVRKTLGAKTSSFESTIGDFLHSAANFFGI